MNDDVVRETTDRVAINDLLATYADVVNRRAFGELDQLFLPECDVVVDKRDGDPILVTGGSNIGAFIDKAIERYDFFQFVILSNRVWLDSDLEARGRLYMCELRHDRASGEPSQAFGVYHDRFRKVDERWWFASRRYHSLARTSTTAGRALDVFAFPDLNSR